MSLLAGTVLDDRYRVIRPLGEGGMGAAYLVEDQRLARECVAKASTVHSAEHHTQFKQEAILLAELSHPNLPEVYDHFFEGGIPCLIMQYVDGETLDRRKEGRTAPFEADEVLRWASDLLDALAYLHGQGPPIIHRDIKPSNVRITPEGKAVLLDFGIARRMSDTSTRTGARAHSMYYSPIEQYVAAEVSSWSSIKQCLDELRQEGVHTGPYSDIYSLGATMYFALTLLDPPDACLRYLGETPKPIVESNPSAPTFLIEAVEQAMIVDPRHRCQSVAGFRRLLQQQAVTSEPPRLWIVGPRPNPARSAAALGHQLTYVAGGGFQIGSDDAALKEACRPRNAVGLGPFCIARAPVTNADYQVFIDNNPEQPVPRSPMRFAQRYNWDPKRRTSPAGLEKHPVVLATWQDALAYCRWLTDVTGYQCRLPTEAEWEKAACWDAAAGHARRYPWGDEFDEARCNVDAHGALRLESSPVGRYSPAGDSPYGQVDMAGNVWEWTGSLYRPYPYVPDDGREDRDADGDRVVRGGAYDEGPLLARCAWRNGVRPGLRLANVGFRVACDAR